MDKEEKEINELNEQVKCTLRISPIHGIGVFAIRDIKQGEKMYCIGSPHTKFYKLSSLEGLRPEVKEIIVQRWPLAQKLGASFQSPNNDARLVSFMNHSENPNYSQKTDTALRDIAKNEEIVENYNNSYKLYD